MTIHTTVTIVGAGQAGLAMSKHLTDRAVDHVVLERGRIAERWQSERWDSLKLLTPNWMSRLPSWQYRGSDPEGFMTMPEITRYLTDYAASFSAPVLDETTVFSARRTDAGFALDTSRGPMASRFLVVATGAAAIPAIPEMAGSVPGDVHQTSPKHYKNPDGLPEGRVLVVGASASGVQLADEIHASGRAVTLAVGSHTRVPRNYRGFDTHLWLDQMGTLDRPYDSVADIDAARRAPSLQLVGGRDGEDLDLVALQQRGVELAGRVAEISGSTVSFADDLTDTCAAADSANGKLLDRMDQWALKTGLDPELDDPTRPAPVNTSRAVHRADLGRNEISTIVWATGYRPDYSWIHMDAVDASGQIAHDGGIVTAVPGMYLLGLPFMRTRRSTFIDGVGRDAEALCAHLVSDLDRANALV
jgi:putative flavoprotein involved in K+ transport